MNCTNSGNMMRIYRLTQSWNENEATWNQRSLGVVWGAPGADGTASRVSTYVNGDCTVTGLRRSTSPVSSRSGATAHRTTASS